MWRVVSVWVMLAGAAFGCEVPRGAVAAQARLLGWINAERTARGLDAYRESLNLAMAARTQACDMAEHGYFGHARPGAPGLGQRIKLTGYALRAGAENLAHTRTLDAETVGRMWKASPPHWRAIIDPGHRDIGLAMATAGGRVYWVMVVAQ